MRWFCNINLAEKALIKLTSQGVVEQQQRDRQKLEPKDLYIHAIEIGDMPVIVTFRVGLARRIFLLRETFHDNTYKRVYGEWKEWEVAGFDPVLNRRTCTAFHTTPGRQMSDAKIGITIARVYCTRETEAAFDRQWTLFIETVEKVTGIPFKFKAFSGDGTGLVAINVDGCKEQIDALGTVLIRRNNPAVSGVNVSDPQEIVKYMVKLCLVHFDRCVTLSLCHINK